MVSFVSTCLETYKRNLNCSFAVHIVSVRCERIIGMQIWKNFDFNCISVMHVAAGTFLYGKFINRNVYNYSHSNILQASYSLRFVSNLSSLFTPLSIGKPHTIPRKKKFSPYRISNYSHSNKTLIHLL